VPVAAAGAQQSKLEGYVGETRPQVRIVTGVPGLDRVQPLLLESLDQGSGASFLEMGHRDHASCVMDNGRDGSKWGESLFHECGPTSPDPTIEGIVGVKCSAMPYDRASDVWPANRTAPRLLQHALEGQLHTMPLQLLDHLLSPPHPVRPAAFQKILELGRVRRHVVTQHVHLTPVRRNRELASGDYPHTKALPFRERLRNSGHRVVIGEPDSVEAGGGGSLHDSFRSHASVGGRRVHVKIDGLRGGGICRSQRRYPVSGAVQAGCDWARRSRSS
jgi:hypothetical protein